MRYYHHDAHGSTRGLTNQNGDIVAKYTYDAYGNPTSPQPPPPPKTPSATQANTPTPKQACNTSEPATTTYDPTTAQFLTRDPITDQTRAPYTYANNNPTNYNDSTGLLFGIPGTPSNAEVIGAIGDGAQAVGETAVGAGDSASFGLASDGLCAIGVDVNKCSTAYRGGTWIPTPSPASWINKGTKVFNAVRGHEGRTDSSDCR